MQLEGPPCGAVFWATTEGLGQEDDGRHPWVVITEPAFHHETKLVLAVPMTSNPYPYKSSDIFVSKLELTAVAGVSDPLRDVEGTAGIVKCAKLRYWSIERVTTPVAHASKFGVLQVKGIICDVLRLKPRRG